MGTATAGQVLHCFALARIFLVYVHDWSLKPHMLDESKQQRLSGKVFCSYLIQPRVIDGYLRAQRQVQALQSSIG